MKFALVLVILGVVAAQFVLAQNGDQRPPPGGDNGKPGEMKPKPALHRLRRQIPGGNGQMGGGGSFGFSAGGQAGGQVGGKAGGEAGGEAGGQAGGQGGAGAQGGADGKFGFGGNAGFSGGAGANGGFGAQGQGQA